MVLGFFKKKDHAGQGDAKPSPAPGSDGKQAGPDPKAPRPDSTPRDLDKAGKFFAHARNTADSRQYEYAIDCYLSGLRHEPDNVQMHEALHDAALKRKVGGGKPAGFSEKLKSRGKTPLEKMLGSEMLWAKDPLNTDLALAVMEAAVAAYAAEPDLHMPEVVYWIGGVILDPTRNAKKITKETCIRVRDLFAAVEAWDRAVEACKMALNMADGDESDLLHDLKNLEAERAMSQGGYTNAGREGAFRDMVKNADLQRELESDRNLSKTEQAILEQLRRRQEEYDKDPADHAKLSRLVDTLVEAGADETENQAIVLLTSVWEKSGQYRNKMRAGDIQMRQFRRKLRDLKARLELSPDDHELKKAIQDLAHQRHHFELEEYAERVKNYPTDMGVLYELGKRLYHAKRYDQAMSALQQAQADPKHRVGALHMLGLCYLAKEWLSEAIATIRRAVELYPVMSDRQALEMRYLLMDVLEKDAARQHSLENAQEAQALASHILQTDIRFRDITKRIETIRTLVETLQKQKK